MDKNETRALTREVSLRIVRHLNNGPARFSELSRLPGTPVDPLLAKHLRRLARDGVVERKVLHVGPPARVEYSLTEFGRTMVQPATAMISWLDANRSVIDAARSRAELSPAAAA